MDKKDSQEKLSLEIIISDLEVISDKCSRDIGSKHWANAELCREDFNRILEKAKIVQPDKTDGIEPIARKHYGLMGTGNNEFACLHEVDTATSRLLARLKSDTKHERKEELLPNLERIFSRFHSVVRQLRDRRENRTFLDVKDEYDIQDLLHALLQIFYDDIRPEEWTPSYAGSASRMDFLLKKHQVVVEVKKTRDNLRDKQIGNQLIEDVAKYKEHPDCKTLVCFIYDPDGFIANSAGLESDLRKQSNDRINVHLYIFPK
jgi:hypothetical protein